jgi:hypothetical protein
MLVQLRYDAVVSCLYILEMMQVTRIMPIQLRDGASTHVINSNHVSRYQCSRSSSYNNAATSLYNVSAISMTWA